MLKYVIEAYLKTLYYVYGFAEPIRVGVVSESADAFLGKNGHVSWAYITSDNPLSVPLSESENARRRGHLRQDLDKFVLLTGEGRDLLGEWPPEQSVFVSGISAEEAFNIGRKFGQRAILFGTYGEPAQLFEILDATGNPCLIQHTPSNIQ